MVAVSSEHCITLLLSRYSPVIASSWIIPNLSDIPYMVTIALASLVACSISLDAPVVTDGNLIASAARPPIAITI